MALSSAAHWRPGPAEAGRQAIPSGPFFGPRLTSVILVVFFVGIVSMRLEWRSGELRALVYLGLVAVISALAVLRLAARDARGGAPLLYLPVLLMGAYASVYLGWLGFLGAAGGAQTDAGAALRVALQSLVFSGMILGVGMLLVTPETLRGLRTACYGYLVLAVAYWPVSGFDFPYQAFMSHKNAFAPIVAFSAFVVLAVAKLERRRLTWWENLSLVVCVALLLLSRSRGMMLAVMAAAGIWVVWPAISRTRMGMLAAFSALAAASIAFPFVYLSLGDLGLASYEGDLTGSVYSGRQYIWPHYMAGIAEAPWLGHGPATGIDGMVSGSVSRFADLVDLSAHNQWLAATFEVGVVGVGFLAATLLVIWMTFRRGRNDPFVRLAAAGFFAVAGLASFEVSLVQNNMTTGFLSWLIFGLGLGRIRLMEDRHGGR